MKIFIIILLSAFASITGCRAQLGENYVFYAHEYGTFTEATSSQQSPGLILSQFKYKNISITVFFLNNKSVAIAYEFPPDYPQGDLQAQIHNLLIKNCPLADNKNTLSDVGNGIILYQANGVLRIITHSGNIISFSNQEYVEFLNKVRNDKML